LATLLQKIQQIISDQLGVDKESVVPGASFIDDLNADQSDLAELIAYIEEEFSTPTQKLEIAEEEIEKLVDVQDLIDLLKDRSIEDD
jgi:acyl carrier protein